MRATILCLATVAALAVTAPGALAITHGQPDGTRHPYVGMVMQDLPGDGAACSGTLISSTVFLTAGHCTDLFLNGGGAIPVTLTFAADGRDFAAQATGTPHTYPGFCSNNLIYHGCPAHGFPVVRFDTGDVGVVILDTAVAMTEYGRLPTPGVVDTLPTGSPVTHVGYGFTDGVPPAPPGPPASFDGIFGLRESAPAATLSGGSLSDQFVRSSGDRVGDGGEMCSGDSGGPLLSGDGPTILAVQAFIYGYNCTGVSYAYRIDQPDVLTWIRGWL